MPRGSGAGQKRKAAEMAVEEEAPGIPFTITCPAKTKRKSGNIFYDSDSPTDDTLKVDFSVEPGTKWEDLKAYKKMKYQDNEFHQGDYVFVNRSPSLPPPPSEDASEDELLAYQKRHMWVGRIQQVKAAKADEVYVRLYWLYWPEELPGSGRAKYHGKQEMILSNHADIIDATTISGAADVTYWNEHDDTEAPLGQIFWRQTLDFNKVGRNQVGGRSSLRKHCICHKEYNPDKTMYRCANVTCGRWNHQECLEDRLLDALKEQLKKGTIKSYLDQRSQAWIKDKEDPKWSIDTIAVGAGKLLKEVGKTVMHRIEGGDDHVETDGAKANNLEGEEPLTANSKSKADLPARSPAKSPTKASVKSSAKATQDNHVEGRIVIDIKQMGAGKSVVAEVKVLPDSATNGASELQKWEIKLDCLVCNQPLD